MSRYAIATGHERTTAVVEDILHAGGNVFDGAIAAHFAMCITEPCMASLGGAGLAMLATADQGVQLLDFFCQTPRHKKKDVKNLDEVLVDFGGTQEHYYAGSASIAVPGTLAGLFAIHDRYGSMPMSVLVRPAISYCKEGITLNTFQQYDLSLLKNIQLLHPYLSAQFMDEHQDVKRVGAITRNPDLADALDYIGREGSRAFYEGDILSVFLKEHDGHLNREDFQAYDVQWQNPRSFNVQERVLYYPSRPSLGGFLLRHFLSDLSDKKHISTKDWSEAYVNMRPTRSDLWNMISTEDNDDPLQPMQRGTSHFSIMDDQGNAIALTSTIGEGSGVVIPGTGIHMNNMLGEEALMPGGLHSWQVAQRLDSMTTPILIGSANQQITAALGSAGAKRIPFITAQVLSHYLSHGDMQRAIDHPRLYDDLNILQVEPGLDVSEINRDLNQWLSQNLYFGGVQGVGFNRNGQLVAGADKRREGSAVLI